MHILSKNFEFQSKIDEYVQLKKKFGKCDKTNEIIFVNIFKGDLIF